MLIPPKRVVALAIVAGAAALPPLAHANTINVTSTADSLTTNGSCSIREAIINANNDAATWPDCAAGSGTDTIVLPAGTITFAIPNPPSSPCCLDSDQQSVAGDLDVLSSMTIVGDPAGTTIDGNQFDRIFDINPDVDGLPETVTPFITVEINGLTMTNARQNQSGAVRIAARATVTMDRCTVSNSEAWADDGGGIFVFTDGALTLTNSTVSGNHALIMGGGIRSDGTLNIVSSTITDNDTGAVFGNLAQALMCGTPSCTLRNSVVAGNGVAPRGDTGGTITSLGYNIIGKTTNNLGEVITIITATTGDQFDVGAGPVDLQPLANNGGPTPTHALGPASIAIDQGESSGGAADQRGELRPCDLAAVVNATGGDGADIGSFELEGPCSSNGPPVAVDDAPSVEVNSGTNTIDVLANDSDPDSDTLTITAVTQAANGAVSNNGTSVGYMPGLNFLGSDTFSYTVDDGHGHADTATVTITVVDTTPPQVTATVGTASLWPPNHRLEDVGLSIAASDNSGAVTTQVSVFSDEDDLAPGSGNHSPDARHIAPATLRLRADRSASGDGRVYLIVVSAADSSSNASTACATVVVPHSNSPQAGAAAAAQAALAMAFCQANAGAAPAGYLVVGDGPVVGPKQ